jgi:hypothetical protein
MLTQSCVKLGIIQVSCMTKEERIDVDHGYSMRVTGFGITSRIPYLVTQNLKCNHLHLEFRLMLKEFDHFIIHLKTIVHGHEADLPIIFRFSQCKF